jgi:hypothetical protein
MTSPNDVITSIFFVDLKSTHQDLLYGVLHNMVPYGTFDFKIWPWGKQISTCSETHERQRRSHQKLSSWVVAHMLLSHRVWSWSDKSYFHAVEFGVGFMIIILRRDSILSILKLEINTFGFNIYR